LTGIECLWIQTSDGKNQPLLLAAERGFSDEMRAEITAMDLGHSFSGEVLGQGGKIIIPNLNHDGMYGLDTFRQAGYHWLVAVPLMTYRACGIMGIASKKKSLLDDEMPELMGVVGGLIANALIKAHLAKDFSVKNKPVKTPEIPLVKPPDKALAAPPEALIEPPPEALKDPPPAEDKTADIIVVRKIAPAIQPEITIDVIKNTPPALSPPPETPLKHTHFHTHSRKMETFRKAHR
jgi:hypothetical protein